MTPWITKPVPFNIGQGGAAVAVPATYSAIIWTNKTEYSATDSSGALNKTSADASWSQMCKSTSSAKPQADLSMKAISTASHHVTYGLSWYDATGPNGSAALDQQSVSYGIYSSSANAGRVYVNATARTASAGSTGDEWEIIMSSTDVVFKLDGEEIYTANAASGEAPDTSKDYYGVCSCYNTSTGLVSASLKT